MTSRTTKAGSNINDNDEGTESRERLETDGPTTEPAI